MFSSWRGTVGIIHATLRPGPLEQFIRLLPEGIGVVPTTVGIRAGTRDAFESVMEAYARQVEILAERGCDLIHPVGAPPFMIQGFDFRRPDLVASPGLGEAAGEPMQTRMHMDIASNVSHLPWQTLLGRGLLFFGWIVGFIASVALIGLIPTVPLFIIAFMRIAAREKWRLVVPIAVVMTLFSYGVFDQLIAIPWPDTVLGDFLPVLKDRVPSV